MHSLMKVKSSPYFILFNNFDSCFLYWVKRTICFGHRLIYIQHHGDVRWAHNNPNFLSLISEPILKVTMQISILNTGFLGQVRMWWTQRLASCGIPTTSSDRPLCSITPCARSALSVCLVSCFYLQWFWFAILFSLNDAHNQWAKCHADAFA